MHTNHPTTLPYDFITLTAYLAYLSTLNSFENNILVATKRAVGTEEVGVV